MSTNKELKPYYHLAKYYETDQMAVVHHSNYIRWFEEARVDYLEQIDFGFEKIEAAGLYCPVLEVACQYKSSVKFNDLVMIFTKITSFNGVKMNIEYRVQDAVTGQLRATGESKHCFVAKEDFRPVSVKKDYKAIYDALYSFIGIEAIGDNSFE